MSLAGKGQETSALTYELHHEPHKHSRKVNNLLANALELMRRYDVDEAKQAEVLLKKALEVEPNAADLLNTLAVSYQLQNRLDEAQALFEQIQIQQPDYILASVIPAQTHLLKGEIAEAEALLLLAQNNKEAAVGWLQLWQQATPDHPLITAWKIALRDQAQVLRAPL
jgi:tetratricopeptide (TPR) repeat protein